MNTDMDMDTDRRIGILNSQAFADFVEAYSDTLFFSWLEEVPDTLEDYQCPQEYEEDARADCLRFFEENEEDIIQAASLYPDKEYSGFYLAGHDFAHTRSKYGVGSWSPMLPKDLADRLTLASEKMGKVSLHLGGDNLIHIEP